MLNAIVRFCVKEPWLVVLLTIGISVFGWYSYRQVPIDAIPASLRRVRRSAIPPWFLRGARSCGRYSQRNATLGSTPAARRAGR